MGSAVRYRFLDPDGLASGQPNLTAEFVRSSDYESEIWKWSKLGNASSNLKPR